MTTALVLGGGGPLGIAWEAGLLTGLARGGTDLAGSELVLGTSAGSVVGATLAARLDLAALPGKVRRPASDGGGSPDLTVLGEIMSNTEDSRSVLERLVDYALKADTVSEDRFRGGPLFADFAGVPWPKSFRCTGIDTGTAQLRVWDADSGADLTAALPASCSVPGVFPPVTVDGTRYVDGGLSSPLNAHLATGYDHVVVVSCFLLGDAPPEIAELRASGADVTLVEPGDEFAQLSEYGAAVMDGTRAGDSYEAGLRQGGRTVLSLGA